MLDGGELPGWVQKMMGHESLQMIHEKYYSHIKNYQRDEGSAFMEKVYHSSTKVDRKEDQVLTYNI
jgi:integrase